MHSTTYENSKLTQSIEPQVLKATANGASVDLQEDGGYQEAVALFEVGTWTDGNYVLGLEHCDDDSTWVSVTSDKYGAATISSGTNDATSFMIAYAGSKRYIRAKITVSGSPTTGLVAGATILRSGPKYRPVSAI